MTGLTRMTSAKYLRNSCTLTAHTLRPHFVPFILVRPVIVQFEIIFVMALSVCGLMCDQFLKFLNDRSHQNDRCRLSAHLVRT